MIRIHFLVEGSVEVISEFGEKVDEMRGPHAYFGEVSFFQKVPRTATIKAATDCLAFTINKPHLETFMNKHPDYSKQIEKASNDRMQNYLERNVLA